MTKNEANKLLNRLRDGHPMPISLTTKALYATGDISGLFGKPLCADGHEQKNNRPCQAYDQAAEVGFSYSQYLDYSKTERTA